jgi:CHAT domain-containing protein
LVIIAEGKIATVPFAALRNRRRGRYLVEDHVLRFATSLADAVRPARRARNSESVLVIADPAIDPIATPGMERLSGAMEEAAMIARQYPRTTVLNDSAATPAALRAALPRADLVHYAGHAVFDDEQPHRSYLALAPEHGRRGQGRGRLTAEEVSAFDLRKVRLVVLSACSTIRSDLGRSGGFSGLAGSFLSARAGGVLGILWRVDDDRAAFLMSEFYRSRRMYENPAAALRDAQLRMLRSPRVSMRSPGAWAGAEYMGT